MRLILLLFVLLGMFGCVQRLGEEPEIFPIVRQNDAVKLAFQLKNGADPNMVNGIGDPLVYVASGPKGGFAVLKLLLQAGADPNVATRRKRTALHNAASWCSTGLVQILLEAGANPHLKADDGRTALDATCIEPKNSRQAIVELLREAMSR